MQLFIRALRNLPQVHVVFHETVDAGTFVKLEHWLDIPLPWAGNYCSVEKVRCYALDAVPEGDHAAVTGAIALYGSFKKATLACFDLI